MWNFNFTRTAHCTSSITNTKTKTKAKPKKYKKKNKTIHSVLHLHLFLTLKDSLFILYIWKERVVYWLYKLNNFTFITILRLKKKKKKQYSFLILLVFILFFIAEFLILLVRSLIKWDYDKSASMVNVRNTERLYCISSVI